MAPELLAGTGYLCSIDWWSLGVIMFEMICGERPFRTKNRKELIKMGIFKFPPSIQLSQNAKDAICGFLRMDAHTRLGVGFEGMMALKKHPFFLRINWLALKYKGISPIFLPSNVENSSKSINGDENNIDVDIQDLQGWLLRANRRKASKIMSGDLLKIYFGFSVFMIQLTIIVF